MNTLVHATASSFELDPFGEEDYNTPTSSSSPHMTEEDEEDYTPYAHTTTKRLSKKASGGSGSVSPSLDPVEKPVSRMNVPLFISKLYQIVHTSTHYDIVGWSSEGQTFVVGNSIAFSKEILPVYFKHNNFSSFVRQLNFYGFKSSSTISLDGKNKRMWEFRHPYFRQNGEYLLHKIKRKTCQQDDSPINLKSDFDDLRADVEVLRAELFNMSKQLEMVTTVLRRAAMAKQEKKRKFDENEIVDVETMPPPTKRVIVDCVNGGKLKDEPIPQVQYGLDDFVLGEFI